jgi:hypothetical protein
MLPIPAPFIIGRDGMVKSRHVDADYGMRMALDNLLAAFEFNARTAAVPGT